MKHPVERVHIDIHPLRAAETQDARRLLGDLNVSLWGVSSIRLHTILCKDGLAGRVAFLVAARYSEVAGLAIAAPPDYVYRLLTAPFLLSEVMSEQVRRRTNVRTRTGLSNPPAAPTIELRSDTPAYTWRRPGPAWRIVFIGVDPRYRGQGVARRLYAALMPGRPLVARVALDNTASLVMHHSSGWLMYPDEGCVLAVRT